MESLCIHPSKILLLLVRPQRFMGIGIGSKLKNEIKWFRSAMAIMKSIFWPFTFTLGLFLLSDFRGPPSYPGLRCCKKITSNTFQSKFNIISFNNCFHTNFCNFCDVLFCFFAHKYDFEFFSLPIVHYLIICLNIKV